MVLTQDDEKSEAATSSQQTTLIPSNAPQSDSPIAVDSAPQPPTTADSATPPPSTPESATLAPSPLTTAESANFGSSAIPSQTQIHESCLSDGSGGVVPASPFPQQRAGQEEESTTGSATPPPASGGVAKSESGPVTPASGGLLSRLKKWQGVESKVSRYGYGWFPW